MNHYLKLVNFEVNRFLKFYLVLIAVIIIMQLGGVILEATSYMNNAEKIIARDLITVKTFTDSYGTYSLDRFLFSSWFRLSIMLGVSMLLLYVLLIWYRDWFGKSKFMYRLLMLPTERRTIYLAKLTTILLFTLGLITLQIFLILLEQAIVNWIVDEEFLSKLTFNDAIQTDIFIYFYPTTILDFILIYGLGIISVAVIFTGVLLERSYHLKGILFALLYAGSMVLVFAAPLILNDLYYYFFPMEIFAITIFVCLLIFGSAVWLANYLLKYKINV
jgi:hypothetical protein